MSLLAGAITDVATEVGVQRENLVPNVTAFDFDSPIAQLLDQSIGTPQIEPYFTVTLTTDLAFQAQTAVNAFISAYGSTSSLPVPNSTPVSAGGTDKINLPVAVGENSSSTVPYTGYSFTPTSIYPINNTLATQTNGSATAAQQAAYRIAQGLVAPSSLATGASLAAYDAQASDG